MKKIIEAINILKERYPDAICSLVYKKDYELLIATRLSAQCTDARVNIVTKELFFRYKSLEDFQSAKIEDIEKIITPCGFFRIKSRDIKLMTDMLIKDFNKKVPDTLENLLKLPGVGMKTANLILGDVYGKPAVVCDTHCIRINKRLGITSSENPDIVYKELKKILPPDESNNYCHRLVLFGREVCKARNPVCVQCPLKNLCDYYIPNNSSAFL